MKKVIPLSLGLLLVSSVLSAPTAFANSNVSSDPALAIQQISPEVIQNVTSEEVAGINISDEPGNGTIAFDESNFGLTIEIKDIVDKNSSLLGNEAVAFWDLGSESVVSILPKEDGSLQIITVIESDSAATKYEYSFESYGDIVLKHAGDGVVIETESGDFVAGIAPAWAKDANGLSVPTHYEIEGTTLIQVVEHANAGFVYPVVADPWLGINLYGSITLNYYSYGYKINITPTTWGISNAGIATWWAHVSEVKTRLGGNAWRWTNSIQEQFYCHLAGIPASLPQYNLESWRPTVNWATSLTSYQCNP